MAVTWALGVHDGFSFSAGLIDYVINWGLATKPWLIIPIGLCFAVVYYVLFRFVITKFNLTTPGREPDEVGDAMEQENVQVGRRAPRRNSPPEQPSQAPGPQPPVAHPPAPGVP